MTDATPEERTLFALEPDQLGEPVIEEPEDNARLVAPVSFWGKDDASDVKDFSVHAVDADLTLDDEEEDEKSKQVSMVPKDTLPELTSSSSPESPGESSPPAVAPPLPTDFPPASPATPPTPSSPSAERTTPPAS